MVGYELEQAYDKCISCEISRVVWSPKMDLFAAVLVNGSVSLYSMMLQRVWTTSPPPQSVAPADERVISVTATCWRPDGRVLMVAYSSGVMCQLELECGEAVHTDTLTVVVCASTWSQLPPRSSVHCRSMGDVGESDEWDSDGGDNDNELDELETGPSDTVLPTLPPLLSDDVPTPTAASAVNSSSHDAHQVAQPDCLTVMAIGCEDGSVRVLLDGVLCVARVQCDTVPVCLSMSPQLHRLAVVCRHNDNGGTVSQLLLFDTSVLVKRAARWRRLAVTHHRLHVRLNYLRRAVTASCDAWRATVLELDAPLSKLANSLCGDKASCSGDDSAISAAMLELLLLGTPSCGVVEHWLLSELGDKGVARLRHTTRVNTALLTRLLQRHVRPALLQLTELLTTRVTPHERAQCCVQRAAGALLCVDRLQAAVRRTTAGLDAWLRWLCAAVRRLAEETPPADCAAMSPRQLARIVHLLSAQLRVSPGCQSVLLSVLPEVGRYLAPADCEPPVSVHQPRDYDASWLQHVQQPGEHEDDDSEWPLVISATDNTSTSLPHCVDLLHTAIDDVFAAVDGGRVELAGRHCLFEHCETLSSARDVVFAWSSQGLCRCLCVTSSLSLPDRQQLWLLETTTDSQLLAQRQLQLPQSASGASVRQVALCSDREDGGELCACVLVETEGGGGVWSLVWLDVWCTPDNEQQCWQHGATLTATAPLCLAVSGERRLLTLVHTTSGRATVYDLV